MKHQYRNAIARLSALGLLTLVACSSSDELPFDEVNTLAGQEALGGSSGAGGSTPADADDDGAPDPVQLPRSVTLTPEGALLCGNSPCQCSNGLDDDGDGTVDGFDVECTGGIDDDEGTFATGIPGDNRDPKWQDCFFDGNSGAGDDRCRYPTECLTGEIAADDPECAVTQACLDNCQPRTPNGCDCFGCCAVQLPGGGQVHVTLGDSCSMEKIGDAEACPVCSPSNSCANECDECELCAGKTAADLPASCTPEPDPVDPPPAPEPPPPDASCSGRSSCDESSDCVTGEFCSLGCCLLVIR
jgi:hypothetical protein